MLGNRDLLVHRTAVSLLSLQFNHCGIQECSPGYQYGFYMKPYHLIHFVLKGSGTLETEGKTYTVRAGQAFYIPSGTAGHYQASRTDPWKYTWLGFFCDSRNPFIEMLFGKDRVADINLSSDELERLILSLLSVTDSRLEEVTSYKRNEYPGEQFFPVSQPDKCLEVNSRMLHLFSRLIQAQASGCPSSIREKDYAQDARAFIDSCYCEPIKIQDAADLLHIHPNYLCSVFKKAYGQTPREYLKALRMERAVTLLLRTDQPVSTIAASVGFSNPFQFSAMFKKYFGLSPAAYRKKG